MSRGVVLVVDDDDTVRRLVRTVLEADDWLVVDAHDGVDAFEQLAEHRPGVMILDVMMPGLDGVAICRKLDHATVKVVMLSARDDAAVKALCMEAGAHAYLTKPFSSTALLDVVEELST